jgi:hypothetical protein
MKKEHIEGVSCSKPICYQRMSGARKICVDKVIKFSIERDYGVRVGGEICVAPVGEYIMRYRGFANCVDIR